MVKEECSGEFESPLIEELVTSVQERITNWVAQIYGEGEGGSLRSMVRERVCGSDLW